jgi:isopentenyldiphosphate isomerase
MEDVLTASPELRETIDVSTGNPVFGTDPEKLNTKEKANQKRFTEIWQEQNTYQPVKTSQQMAADIRRQGRALGLSKAQQNTAISENIAYRKELSSLDEGQLAQVASMDASVDNQVELQMAAADANYDSAIDRARMTPQQAKNKLNLSETDVHMILNGTSEKGTIEIGRELGWFRDFFSNKPSVQIAGIDVKEKVSAIFKNNPDVPPWMVLEALYKSIDTEKGAQNIDESDFEDTLNLITNTPDAHERLFRISDMDNQLKIEKIAIKQAGDLRKSSNVASIKAKYGVRNTERNASIFNTRYKEAVTGTTPPNKTPTYNINYGLTQEELNAEPPGEDTTTKATPDKLPTSKVTFENDPEVKGISDRLRTIFESRANSTTPLSFQQSTEVLKLRMQLLDIADASPAIKSRAQKLTDDLIRRMGEYSQKNKRK